MLLRIDENVEIDMSYITCAEYQLFIDEKLKAGAHRQPDHWKSYRFPPGDAQKPITGVRSSDAKEFCEWLTQQQSAPIFKYRLPTLAEVEECRVTEKQVGCWCFDGEQRIIVGIETEQQQTWQEKLAEVLDLNRDLEWVDIEGEIEIDIYRDLYRTLYNVLYRDLYQDLYDDIKRVLARVLYHDFDRDLNRVHYGDLYYVLYRDFYHDIERDIERNLYRDLYPVLYHLIDRDLYRGIELELNRDIERNLYRDLYRVLYRDFDRDLYRILDRELDSALYCVLDRELRRLDRALQVNIKAGKASDYLLLYFPLFPVIVIYHFLSETYELISKNKTALNTIKLSRQESEAISRKYLDNFSKIYPLYVYLVLLDERQSGRIPAWESIRIVRERVE